MDALDPARTVAELRALAELTADGRGAQRVAWGPVWREARTWLRTLDDRLGVSRDERERKQANPAVALPATEPLLADKPEHRFERRAEDRISADNRWVISSALSRSESVLPSWLV